MPIFGCITDVERSNAELRAVLILAGQQIRKLNFGKKDTALLRLMRRTLREARVVAKHEGVSGRVRMKLG